MIYLSTFTAKFVILFFGLLGNTIGIIVFSRKSIEKKIKTKLIYQVILFINSLFLFSQVFQDTFDSFEIRLHRMSIIACKLRGFWNFAIGPLTKWYLVYITIERFLAIKFHNFKLFQEKRFQKIIIIAVIIYTFLLYSPYAIFYDIFTIKSQNTTGIRCRIEDNNIRSIMASVDTVNSTLLPFIMISVFSLLLIYTIISSRIRAMRMQATSARDRMLKDIRLSLCILAINFTIFLSFPLEIANYFVADIDVFLYDIYVCIFYVYYCLDTFILILLNSNFKNELLLMFKLKT
jgi:hypothetical protein